MNIVCEVTHIEVREWSEIG